MGSIARFSALERFEQEFGERLTKHFSYLIGQTVTGFSDTEVEYWVRADVALSGGEVFEVHHRWATEEESYEGKEILEEGDITMNEWLNEYAKGQAVTSVSIGNADRDDEAYLFLTLENGNSLECRLGYHSEDGTVYGLAKEILSEEEIKAFEEKENNRY